MMTKMKRKRSSTCVARSRNCSKNSQVRSTSQQKKYLNKKQLALDQREKELLKKERVLQHKIKKYNKRDNRKAKADKKAANKLNRARKKLLSALDSKDRLKKKRLSNSTISFRIWKRGKGKLKKKKQKSLIDTITGCPIQYITELVNKPCHCNQGLRRVRRRVPNVESSCLRRIFGDPCSCQPAPKRKYADGYGTKLGNMLQACRCEAQDARTRYGPGGDCYLMTLRQTPQVWIHHRWPRLYPHYLGARHQWKNLRHCLLFCAGILIWTPCILFLELCKCFCCACCSD